MKIYLELTERFSGLKQTGYLNNGGITFKLPFILTDKELAEEFGNPATAANAAVYKLNMGFYSAIRVDFE